MFQPLAFLKRPTTPAPTININSDSYEHDVVDPADATAGVSFNSDGTVTKEIGNTGTDYNWRTGGGAGGDYEIYFETSGGAVSTGVTDEWQALSSNRGLTCVRTSLGAKTWSGNVIIRRASDGTEMDRAAIAINAVVGNGL